MSNIFDDMRTLYYHYGFFDEPLTKAQLDFRIKTLQLEEYTELQVALDQGDSEEIVDALIDMIVIAAGTLELLGVDSQKAWDEVLKSNFSKERGVKSTRPESGGFDLIKPPSWKKPSHDGNHGRLNELF